jgi:hypothetical protein
MGKLEKIDKVTTKSPTVNMSNSNSNFQESSKEEEERLANMFRKLDKDGDGKIDIHDLSAALKRLGMSDHYAEVLIQSHFLVSSFFTVSLSCVPHKPCCNSQKVPSFPQLFNLLIFFVCARQRSSEIYVDFDLDDAKNALVPLCSSHAGCRIIANYAKPNVNNV